MQDGENCSVLRNVQGYVEVCILLSFLKSDAEISYLEKNKGYAKRRKTTREIFHSI